MKKYLLNFSIAFLLILTSCVSSDKGQVNNMPTDNVSDNSHNNTYLDFKDSFIVNVISETYYKISKSQQYAGEFYVIYDTHGDIIDEGYHDGKGSLNITQAENIITVEELSDGKSGGTYTFYDVASGRVSRRFEGPLQTYKDKVAYFDLHRSPDDRAVIVVRDMFDRKNYYFAVGGKFDNDICKNFVSMVFSEDGKEITLKYNDYYNNEVIEKFTLK